MRVLITKIVDYVTSVILGVVVDRTQTLSILDKARQRELLEDEAQRLDEDGKPELAEQLRRQARTLETPADVGRLLERIDAGYESTADDADGPQKITQSNRGSTSKTNAAANKPAAKKG